jgi:hypothetical protein
MEVGKLPQFLQQYWPAPEKLTALSSYKEICFTGTWGSAAEHGEIVVSSTTLD